MVQVVKFFSCAANPQENVAQLVCMQQQVAPALRFLTLGSAMGVPLINGEILAPAISMCYKAALTAPDFTKFAPARMIVNGQGRQAHERVIVARPGSMSPVTLIQPAKLIVALLEAGLTNIASDSATQCDGYARIVCNLVGEYRQHLLDVV